MPKLARILEFYTCDYKCGTKAKSKEKMIAHEKICFCNPKNKSCRICENCLSSHDKMTCQKLNLYIYNKEKAEKVYDCTTNNVVWKHKSIVDKANNVWDLNIEDYLKNIDRSPKTDRPFPTTNCEHFVLAKKRF